MVDREFQSISDFISKYSIEVKEKANKGELDIPIDSTSLFEYLSERFNLSFIEKTFNNVDRDLIEELHLYGIDKLKDLDDIISTNYITMLIQNNRKINFAGIIRDILIISDHEKYFSKCWSKNHWNGMTEDTYKFFKSFNIPMDLIIEKYNLYLDRS